jgi:hypothetical protein
MIAPQPGNFTPQSDDHITQSDDCTPRSMISLQSASLCTPWSWVGSVRSSDVNVSSGGPFVHFMSGDWTEVSRAFPLVRWLQVLIQLKEETAHITSVLLESSGDGWFLNDRLCNSTLWEHSVRVEQGVECECKKVKSASTRELAWNTV